MLCLDRTRDSRSEGLMPALARMLEQHEDELPVTVKLSIYVFYAPEQGLLELKYRVNGTGLIGSLWGIDRRNNPSCKPLAASSSWTESTKAVMNASSVATFFRIGHFDNGQQFVFCQGGGQFGHGFAQ